MGRTILKGAIIFGAIGAIVFIVILTLGFILSMFGVSCECFSIFRWSIIGIAILSGIVFWYGCCCKPTDAECTGVKGYKDEIKS